MTADMPTDGPVDKGIGPQMPDVPGYGPGTTFNAGANATHQVGNGTDPSYPVATSTPITTVPDDPGVAPGVGHPMNLPENQTLESGSKIDAGASDYHINANPHPIG